MKKKRILNCLDRYLLDKTKRIICDFDLIYDIQGIYDLIIEEAERHEAKNNQANRS